MLRLLREIDDSFNRLIKVDDYENKTNTSITLEKGRIRSIFNVQNLVRTLLALRISTKVRYLLYFKIFS